MASKFALVIANTEYQDASFAKLTAPGNDAEEFAHVLREPELAAFDEVRVLINEGESISRRSIARFFANRKRDDLLLFYFSGHGIRNDQGQLFLAVHDTEINILEASGIPAEFVTQAMNNSRSQRQVLILDCCNSGAFAQGSKSASAVGKSMGIATAFEGSGFGRIVLTATDATQYAWEGDKVIGTTQKSVFTHFLIEGLKGDADHNGDGRIDVDELYDYAYEQVVRQTPKQTPGKWSYKQQGDLILRENLKPRDVKPAPLPSELLYYLEHSSSGVRTTGVQELIRLLEGKNLGLARAAQDKLREIAANDDSLTLRKTASDTLIARGLTLEQPEPLSSEILKEEHSEEKKVEKGPIVQPHDSLEVKKVAPNINLRLIGGIIGGLLLIALLILGGENIFGSLSTTPDPTETSRPIATRTTQPTNTTTPTPTQTSIPPTPTLGIGSTIISQKDNMTLLYIPAGEFSMGSDNGEVDEKPVHTVYLDAYWMDKTEVTNAMYANCVDANKCNVPANTSSNSQVEYFGNPNYNNHPVIYVTWNDANDYCTWVDRRLPTEAEWEKAARGENAFTYPWGNVSPKNDLLNYNSAGDDITEVGDYPEGASPYGVLDMAGNVFEWAADWYDEKYYVDSPASNPLGPTSGSGHIVRGGSWRHGPTVVRSANRESDAPTYTSLSVGFRCAMSATP